MTNKQFKICGIVVRKHTLDRILRTAHCADYMALQQALPPGALVFCDDAFGGQTPVVLADFAQEEYDKYVRDAARYRYSVVLSTASFLVSLVALLFSSCALFGWPFTPA